MINAAEGLVRFYEKEWEAVLDKAFEEIKPWSDRDLKYYLELQYKPEQPILSKKCGYCGLSFPTGPRTRHRSHAIYCCDKHRVAASRLR